MKRYIGLFVLGVALIMIGGCTQQAQPAVTTPVATVIETTVPTIPPAVATPEKTPTQVQIIVPTVETTNLSKPKITLVPQTTKTVIYIRNNTFSPAELTVLPGTGISWVNDDTVAHSVKTTGMHAGMFNSGELIPTASWDYTFGEVGVFEFIDPNYPAMKGTIEVKEGESVVGAPTLQTPSP